VLAKPDDLGADAEVRPGGPDDAEVAQPAFGPSDSMISPVTLVAVPTRSIDAECRTCVRRISTRGQPRRSSGGPFIGWRIRGLGAVTPRSRAASFVAMRASVRPNLLRTRQSPRESDASVATLRPGYLRIQLGSRQPISSASCGQSVSSRPSRSGKSWSSASRHSRSSISLSGLEPGEQPPGDLKGEARERLAQLREEGRLEARELLEDAVAHALDVGPDLDEVVVGQGPLVVAAAPVRGLGQLGELALADQAARIAPEAPRPSSRRSNEMSFEKDMGAWAG
jgi:hypothetical protein